LLRRALEETLKEPGEHLSSPEAVKSYLRLFLGGQEYESFVAIWLDAQNRLIASMEMFRGTTTQTSVYPREIVRTGLKLNASAVLFAHNHPSGSVEPSRADEMLTSQLRQALSACRYQGAGSLHRDRHFDPVLCRTGTDLENLALHTNWCAGPFYL
jgi:DNA repair protein RadC